MTEKAEYEVISHTTYLHIVKKHNKFQIERNNSLGDNTLLVSLIIISSIN